MNSLRTFSIIIPTYNRLAGLVACLRGIAALDYPRSHIQVVVVNDGGTEIPQELVAAWKREFAFLLLNQENRGAGAARNLGARHALNAWLAFTDDDCVPAADWLMRFASRSASEPEAVLGGETRNGLPDNVYAAASQCLVSFLLDYYHRGTAPRSQVPFFTANNLALSRRVFDQVGGFDPALRVAEERDFCERLTRAGFGLRYVPEARVEHFRPMNFNSFWQQHASYGKGAFYYQRNRSAAGANNLGLEPVGFYARMLAYPLRYAPHVAGSVVGLVAISQLANVFGFFQESFRARRSVNSLSAQKSL